jgi:hypothetical protein
MSNEETQATEAQEAPAPEQPTEAAAPATDSAEENQVAESVEEAAPATEGEAHQVDAAGSSQ